jgi:hypothetical protein
MRADPDVPHLSDICSCDVAAHTTLYSLNRPVVPAKKIEAKR